MYQHIRDLREDGDFSQKQIAEILFVNQTTYSRYERCEIDIPCSSLIILADFYGVSVDYLLGRSNDR